MRRLSEAEDKMYYDWRTAMSEVQRARIIVSSEQESSNTDVRGFEMEVCCHEGCRGNLCAFGGSPEHVVLTANARSAEFCSGPSSVLRP